MKKILLILMFMFMLVGIGITIAGALTYNTICMASGILVFVVGAILHDLWGKE